MKDLNQLLQVAPGNKALEFLVKRIPRDDYRGFHLSQHNRFTQEDVINMLIIMRTFVGSDLMQIRDTDLKKRPNNIPGEETYARYVDKVHEINGKGTQDSIRKNFFVDLHRMGLISRYSRDREFVGPYEGKSIKFVSLSDLGRELIGEHLSAFERYMLFSRALNNLLQGLALDILEIVTELKYISLHEFTFFVSYLHRTLDKTLLTKDHIKDCLWAYRRLSLYQQKQVVSLVKTICDPERFVGDKTNKRDFHNWRNEAQQLFPLLAMTVFYEYNKPLERLFVRVGSDALFETQAKLKRSLSEKKGYFINHQVDKALGFELHHIVPLSWARNREEFFVLDKWQNMLYIDGYKHAKISQNNSKHVELIFLQGSADVILQDAQGNALHCVYEKNVKYSVKLQKVMREFNLSLLDAKTL